MTRIKPETRTHAYHFTASPTVKQEQYKDGIKLMYPEIRVLLGKDAGELFTEGTVPANKMIKLVFGEVKSDYVLTLTPIQNDKYIATPSIIVSPLAYGEVCMMVQTIKAVPVQELSTAILYAIT